MLLLVTLSVSAFAVPTTILTTLSEQPSISDISFIAYFYSDKNNPDDSIILTEDSYNDTPNAGYNFAKQRCEVQTIKFPNIDATYNYDIWVSVDDNNAKNCKAGKQSKLPIGNPGTATTPTLQLDTANYLATPVLAAQSMQGAINLSWTSVVGATSYSIYFRKDTDPFVYTKLITLPASETSHPISNAAPNVGYRYLIIASAENKRSGHGNEVSAMALGDQPANLTKTTLTAKPTTIKAGEPVQLNVQAIYDIIPSSDVTFLANYSNAEVNKSNGTIIFKKVGEYKLNATYQGMPSEDVTITVTPAALKDYTVILAPANPVAGQTVNISIKDNVGIDEFGNNVAISSYSPTSWKKDQAGTYNIDVMADEIPKPVPVTVVHDITSDIIVTPASALVELGDKLTITAKGIDQLGNETGTASTSYTATKLGDNKVTMTIDTISKEAIVKVIPKIESILISDNNAVVTNDLTLNIKAKDSFGKEVELSQYGLSYVFENADNGVFSVAGKEDGAYTVKATLNTKSPLTAEAIINLNINAPVITVVNDLNETIVNGAILPSLPKLSISVADASGINTDVKIFIDGIQVKASEIQASSASVSGVKSYTVAYAAAEKLSVGTHTLKITAQDILKKPAELTISGLKVYAGVSVTGTPLNYPNPVKPLIDLKTTIKYTLAADHDVDVKIIILDVTGKQVYTQLCAAGSEGGRVGINKVEYDCKDTAGNVLGNGVYHYLLINEGQVIGRGQIAVLD